MWAGQGEIYERIFMQQTAHTIEPLLTAAGVTSGMRVLDVGTGPGPVAAAAISRGAVVTAVDADPWMVERARTNVPAAEVCLGTLPELELADGSFDAVVGNFIINCVALPRESLLELRRVLRDGGRFALTCWHRSHTVSNALVLEALTAAGVDWPSDLPDFPMEGYTEPDTYLDLVREAGFSAVEVTELTWDHIVDPEVWWSGPANGFGQTGTVLNRLDAHTKAGVKAAYDDLAARYRTADGMLALPACALVAAGFR